MTREEIEEAMERSKIITGIMGIMALLFAILSILIWGR